MADTPDPIVAEHEQITETLTELYASTSRDSRVLNALSVVLAALSPLKVPERSYVLDRIARIMGVERKA